jgi:hypothetical protein
MRGRAGRLRKIGNRSDLSWRRSRLDAELLDKECDAVAAGFGVEGVRRVVKFELLRSADYAASGPEPGLATADLREVFPTGVNSVSKSSRRRICLPTLGWLFSPHVPLSRLEVSKRTSRDRNSKHRGRHRLHNLALRHSQPFHTDFTGVVTIRRQVGIFPPS